jgi:hypothetical protein
MTFAFILTLARMFSSFTIAVSFAVVDVVAMHGVVGSYSFA